MPRRAEAYKPSVVRHDAERRSVRVWSAACSTTLTTSSAPRSPRSSSARWFPHRDRWETSGIVDRNVFTSAGANGFLGIDVAEEYGGGGVTDFRFNVVIAEELQRADVNAAGLGITLHNDICLPVLHAPDQRRAEEALASRNRAPAN